MHHQAFELFEISVRNLGRLYCLTCIPRLFFFLVRRLQRSLTVVKTICFKSLVQITFEPFSEVAQPRNLLYYESQNLVPGISHDVVKTNSSFLILIVVSYVTILRSTFALITLSTHGSFMILRYIHFSSALGVVLA